MSTVTETLASNRWTAAATYHLRNCGVAMQRFSAVILLVPVAIVCLILFDARSGLGWFEEKATQEIIAPTVLAVAVFVAGLYWARAGDFCSRWLLLLSVALFCRELHFWGTNNGIYAAVLLLLWYASRHASQMQSFLESRIQISLLVGALCTYALSKTFDRAYWSFIHGWTDWQDTMEESLESTAHLMVLVLVAASYWNWGCLERGGRAVQGPRTRRVTVWALLGGSAIAAVLTTSRWYVETPKLPRARFAAFPAELSSLCNVGSELGHNLFLASSDEAHKLTIWALDENQTPSVIQHVELKIPITDENSLHLDDLEDIAWDERGTYYAISSHRHIVPSEDAARRKKSQGTECALVSFQLNRDEERFVVTNARLVTQSLLAKIRELGVFPSIDWQRSKVFSWRGLVKTWQLDIEGLAYVDKKLLIGFKNPIEGGRATILSYDIESDELSVAARPEFGGHGILGMHYDSCSNALYVLANHPIKHRFDDSCLWVGTRDQASGKWSFSLDRKYLVEAARLKTRRKASGMTTRDGTVAICFDSETESPIKVLALDDLMQPRKLR